jgi:ABC-2 type transport system ATP-binding protein
MISPPERSRQNRPPANLGNQCVFLSRQKRPQARQMSAGVMISTSALLTLGGPLTVEGRIVDTSQGLLCMIEIRHLRKQYDSTVAIDNLTLLIPEGEVFGLIGPNGAGKTTLIRILATLMEPTYGEVKIAGIDVCEAPLEVHPLIGYMSDFFSMYEDMLVWEYLDHFAACYGIERARREQLIDDVLELVSLEVRRDDKIKALSRGMKQRLCFAKTLLHQPKVLLLDEPASGLDPAGRIEFREILKKLRDMGRTVLISSHILTEMADFCTSIGIVEQGRLLASGRVEDILRQLKSRMRLVIEVAAEQPRLVALLKEEPAVEELETRDGHVTCAWGAAREDLPALHRRLVQASIPLVSLSVKKDDLEDIYMRISGHRTS